MRMKQSLVLLAALSLAPLTATAGTIDWTQWSGSAINNPDGSGIVTGVLTVQGVPIGVTYTGQLYGPTANVFWQPASTFDAGNGNAPTQYGVTVLLDGGPGYTQTITFSSPVVNPYLAIWSLGAQTVPVFYNFTAAEPFYIVSAGSASAFGSATTPYPGSQGITKSGTMVNGSEGNGVIEFIGTYSSITFTQPIAEHFSGITVGAPDSGIASSAISTTPEPSSLALLGTGLFGLIAVGRRKLRKA